MFGLKNGIIRFYCYLTDWPWWSKRWVKDSWDVYKQYSQQDFPTICDKKQKSKRDDPWWRHNWNYVLLENTDTKGSYNLQYFQLGREKETRTTIFPIERPRYFALRAGPAKTRILVWSTHELKFSLPQIVSHPEHGGMVVGSKKEVSQFCHQYLGGTCAFV